MADRALFFSTNSRMKLAALLRETSRRGLERVLAISLSRRAIDPEAIWNLLAKEVSVTGDRGVNSAKRFSAETVIDSF